MFRTTRSLTIAVLSTAGILAAAPRPADAQITIERVYDLDCGPRCYDYAGTLTVDCASYRISTRCSILDQVEEVFLCRGYDVCRVGRTIRVYHGDCAPDVEWCDGLYGLRIRQYHHFTTIALLNCNTDFVCAHGSHQDGYCYRIDDHGLRFGIHLDFGRHDNEICFDFDRHDHDDRFDHGRRHDRRDDDRSWRGRDDYRDGRNHDRDRLDDRRGERTGDRTYITPERPLPRPDDDSRAPRQITPAPDAKPVPGNKTPERPIRRGTKMTQPREDDRSSRPGDPDIKQPGDRIIVREPDTIKREAPSRPVERALPKPPSRTSAPAKQPQSSPSQRPAKESQKQPAKEAPRTTKPAQSDKTDKKDSNQKRDRRW
ncbi:MAG: hypothetical protein AB7G11_05025 [Phycisphaerales bacterium]